MNYIVTSFSIDKMELSDSAWLCFLPWIRGVEFRTIAEAWVVSVPKYCCCPGGEVNLVTPLILTKLLAHFYFCPLIEWWSKVPNCVSLFVQVLTIKQVFVERPDLEAVQASCLPGGAS